MQPPGPAHLVLQAFHHPQAVVQAGQGIGDREALELGAALAQPRDHVVEDLSQIADLPARRHGQAHLEIALRDFARGLREPVDRTHDQQAQQIRERTQDGQQQRHDPQRDVAQPGDLSERLRRRDLGHHHPVEGRHDAHAAHDALAREAPELDRAAFARQQPVRGVTGVALPHQLARAAARADDEPAGAGHQIDLARVARRKAPQRVGHRVQVDARRQGPEQLHPAGAAPGAPCRLDRHGHEHLRVGARRVPVRRAEGPIVLGELGGPVGRQRHGAGMCRARRHEVAVLIEYEQLGVIGEAVTHRIEVVGEPLEVDPRMDRLAVREGDALEVLRDFIRAREHAQVVAQPFGPEIDFTLRLRGDAQQFLGGFGLERAPVFDIRNPDRRQRRQQRRDDGEHQHLRPDAGKSGKAQKTQVRISSRAATRFMRRRLLQDGRRNRAWNHVIWRAGNHGIRLGGPYRRP